MIPYATGTALVDVVDTEISLSARSAADNFAAGVDGIFTEQNGCFTNPGRRRALMPPLPPRGGHTKRRRRIGGQKVLLPHAVSAF
jgi:hypothetical protein